MESRRWVPDKSSIDDRLRSLEHQLLLNSGRETPLVIARQLSRTVEIFEPVIDGLITEIKRYGIDLLIVDPVIHSHELSENDNMAINLLMRQYNKIASAANCAIELVAHVRKGNKEDNGSGAEAIRGAKSFTDAARSARAVERMTKKEAEDLKLSLDENLLIYLNYFHAMNVKANMALPSLSRTWFKLDQSAISNGDGDPDKDTWVQYVTRWEPPDALQQIGIGSDEDLCKLLRLFEPGNLRSNSQNKDWAGYKLAAHMDLDIGQPQTKGAERAWSEEQVSNRDTVGLILKILFSKKGLILSESIADASTNRRPTPTWKLTKKGREMLEEKPF